MKDLRTLDQYRDTNSQARSTGGRLLAHPDREGIFNVPIPTANKRRRKALRVVASADLRWDHVSVSLPDRCPTWPEMCRIKDLFFHDHETVMQLHVPPADWISNHPYCLHLWRPHDQAIPRPPGLMVGVAGMSEEEARDLSPEARAAIRKASTEELIRNENGNR